MYVANKLDTYYLIKTNDTGVDANSLVNEKFKNKLLNIVERNGIKLVIDIHGTRYDRNFETWNFK